MTRYFDLEINTNLSKLFIVIKEYPSIIKIYYL